MFHLSGSDKYIIKNIQWLVKLGEQKIVLVKERTCSLPFVMETKAVSGLPSELVEILNCPKE